MKYPVINAKQKYWLAQQTVNAVVDFLQDSTGSDMPGSSLIGYLEYF